LSVERLEDKRVMTLVVIIRPATRGVQGSDRKTCGLVLDNLEVVVRPATRVCSNEVVVRPATMYTEN
jgi:hypothetical protein